MKVVKLNEWTPKQFLSPTFNPKIAQYSPKKSNNPMMMGRFLQAEVMQQNSFKKESLNLRK